MMNTSLYLAPKYHALLAYGWRPAEDIPEHPFRPRPLTEVSQHGAASQGQVRP